jgi:hypothetical protein
MAENPTEPGPVPERTPEPAAAEWLLRDAPAPTARPAPATITPGGESFELADGPTPPPTRRPSVPPPSEPAAKEGRPRPDRPPVRRLDSATAVDSPWTRWAEWGPTIAAMAAWGVVALSVIYFLLVSELYGAALAAFAVGTIVGLALFYPIVVTLERPTRATPEHAALDYYQALSHHLPHYRRMWLLLSNAGRTSTKFASYEGFKRYWKGRFKQLREGKARGTTPLTFVVSGFKSEKSGGKTEIDATWTIQVFVRGRREGGPIRSFSCDGTFARGPDNMWYIDDGTLDDPPAKRPAEAVE